MRSLIFAVGLGLVCLPAQGGTEFQRTGLVSHLITDVRVQRELRLTDAQCDVVWDLRWKTSGRLGDLIRERIRKREPRDRRTEEQEVRRIEGEHSATLAKILSREQFARYEQIRLQYLREEALLDPAIQEAIKLDGDRARRLEAIFRKYLEDCDCRLAESLKLLMKEQLRLVSSRMLEDIRSRDQALRQMRDSLTDEQRAAFLALKGPEFRVKGRELGSIEHQATPRSLNPEPGAPKAGSSPGAEQITLMRCPIRPL